MNLYPSNNPHKRSCEVNHFRAQEKIFYEFLLQGWFTARQVEGATGITISNLTLYKRDLEKSGRLWTSDKKVKCPVTGQYAKQITTNPNLIPGKRKEVNHA